VHDKDKKFPCRFKKCTRKGDHAFTRKDHLTEHLRNYHKQAIEKKGRRGAAEDDVMESDDEQQEVQRFYDHPAPMAVYFDHNNNTHIYPSQ
jgi:hypothetical protein